MGESKKKKDIDFLDENYLKISNALNDEERTRKSLFYIFIIALCIIGSIFLIELILVVCFYDIDKLGAFGDFFGGMINPLLTFCTFMALLMTIILQQKELSLTREELSETKQATKDSAQALREQSNSIKVQNFENTFFNMITLHNEIVKNLKIKNHIIEYSYELLEATENSLGEIEIQRIETNFNLIKQFDLDESIFYGKEAFEHICNNIDTFLNIRSNNKKLFKNIFKIKNINLNRKPTFIYDLCHQCYSNIIGHYFGNIYQILKFISTSENIDKRKYSDLFRAQFSAQELQLLFYHCSGSIGSTKFKPLIEEFEFLKHLSIKGDNDFFKYIFYHNIYKNKAFGIKNKSIIDSINIKIKDKIDKEIKDKIDKEVGSPKDKIDNPNQYKYKYLDFYKYFSKEEIDIFLPKLKENSLITEIVCKKLALEDYSTENRIKSYIFREE
ncbi:putative phage abortive infection protein [Aliarcobacter butzleri]|uniref:putative phage abortive infection protein n=1 Tax=Aliarcobacter butzleri TaxID=28197 RepID=UPI001EDC65AB|nr:putative phage abortive infection protein [Aliarcobacter butzleri]